MAFPPSPARTALTWGCGRPSVDLDVNLVFLGAAAISPAQKFLRGGIFTVAHYWIIGTIITNQPLISPTHHAPFAMVSLPKTVPTFPEDAFVESRCLGDLLRRP